MNLDPQRIGVMGFSAGGHLSAMASNNFDKRTYPPWMRQIKQVVRPDFCLLVYPAYLDGEITSSLGSQSIFCHLPLQ